MIYLFKKLVHLNFYLKYGGDLILISRGPEFEFWQGMAIKIYTILFVYKGSFINVTSFSNISYLGALVAVVRSIRYINYYRDLA